jgi:SAM-dependent methyltransferase
VHGHVSASDAFGAFAKFYDAYTAHPDYGAWVQGLYALGRSAGTSGGRRVLDLGCGTGNSVLPLLDLDCAVTGCDAAGTMLDVARAKADGRATLIERDITRLARVGEFDVALCVNDVVNYVLTAEGVRRLIACAAKNLAPGGALVFDANTLRTFRVTFATSHLRVRGGLTFRWSGRAPASFGPGEVARADIDVHRGMGPARRCCAASVHLQRHHPHEELVDAIEAAGLRLHHVFGQYGDGRRDPVVDERRHLKAVYVATSASRQEGR